MDREEAEGLGLESFEEVDKAIIWEQIVAPRITNVSFSPQRAEISIYKRAIHRSRMVYIVGVGYLGRGASESNKRGHLYFFDSLPPESASDLRSTPLKTAMVNRLFPD